MRRTLGRLAGWILERMRTRAGLAALSGAVAVLIIGTGLIRSGSSGTEDDGNATFTVREGPLTISIRESGTIKARDQVVLKCEVEGQTQIITLVPEGASVKKGDLLVELDASMLTDGRVDQQIRVQNLEAELTNSRENLEVVESKSASDVKAAELVFQFAKEDQAKYIDGDYPMEVKRAQAGIAVAESEESRTKEQLAGSKRLFDQGYLTAIEYERDKQIAEKAVLDLELARSSMQLLEEYTYKRTMTQLNSAIEEAESALSRAKLTAGSAVVQAEALLRAKESEFNRERDKLEKLDRQIELTKIFAPADGLVVYATTAQGRGFRFNSEPLEEGQAVRERQELIYLPTAGDMMAEISVHESNLAKIRPGMGVRITADAVPDATFTGYITGIAPMPDAQSAFMNPDLKVYPTKVTIEGDASALRTGMNCEAEIMVEHLENAVHVPVQSIYTVKGVATAFVKTRRGVEYRPVVVGNDNNQMIHVIEGLEAGEEVLLAPPLDAATKIEDPDADKAIGQGFVEADETKISTPVETAQPAGAPAGAEATGPPGGDWSNLSDEERNERRQRFMSMSEEERDAMMQERMKDMTPEQRKAIEERMRQFSEGQGSEKRSAE